jgi:hypothetical protein
MGIKSASLSLSSPYPPGVECCSHDAHPKKVREMVPNINILGSA